MGMSTNRELFAGNREGMRDALESSLSKITASDLRQMMEYVNNNLKEYEPGDYIMTDDKAPVELLGMRVIDELISDEVNYYKEIYREKGLEALLEAL